MLLLDKSVCTPDAQCNAKMCALAESLQRMYDITSPKRASPRRIRCQGLGSDARACESSLSNLYLYVFIYMCIYVSVYIFALA